MPALIAASTLRTCLGDGEQTFAGLLAGRAGVSALRHPVTGSINVTAGYHIDDTGTAGGQLRASGWLTACVAQAAQAAGLDTTRQRVVALVGTGLRELAAVEASALHGTTLVPSRLHFGPAVRAGLPGVAEVITISNACSAGGHALALAQDMVECGDADAVIVGAADAMTTSMLAMIGRVADQPTDRVRPFDAERMGVLLGEGAAAVVVVPNSWTGPTSARLVSTGLSCDAHHETALDVTGICRAIDDAFSRGGRDPKDVDLVLAHGTGTALNDPAESEALRRTLIAAGANPLVTGVKGSVGHTSGAAALVNLDVAIRCLHGGVVPPIVGLRQVLHDGSGLNFVRDSPVAHPSSLVQVNAFGFGGVNAVTLLEAP